MSMLMNLNALKKKLHVKVGATEGQGFEVANFNASKTSNVYL